MENECSRHITPQRGKVCKADRMKINGHKPVVIWFTGLSGSGKSTLAYALEHRLFGMGCRPYVLDGDNVRTGLNKELRFSKEDREENIRRIGEVSKLFVDAGTIVLSAFISPYKRNRDGIRKILDSGEFVEAYVKCPLEVCERRDPKGLYKKARGGTLKQFTGIDDPYEEPDSPELVIDTENLGVEECVDKLMDYLQSNGYLGEGKND